MGVMISGNYKGFGDSKFVPRLSPEAFEKLVSQDDKAKALFESTGGKNGGIFASSNPGLMHLGFPDSGHLSTYYPDSPTITKSEIEIISTIMAEYKILPENTRLKKLRNGDFELLIASGISNPPEKDINATNGQTQFHVPISDPNPERASTLHLVYGDHKEEMAKSALAIKKAAHYTANDTQKSMLDAYALSFGTGSLNAFRSAQTHWVKDLGPTVETNIGFVETYRDPAGIRAEWEGFVAMVNKERTAAFGRLVSAAPTLIPSLPWPSSFEKDTFQAPDFTSLEVLAFPSSGIPAGINIPNYDDIRQNIGFKNVSLGNVLGAKAPNQPVPFVHPDDLDLYLENRDLAWEVQVGIHELLGHGTGKLLAETATGEFNFDRANPPLNPVTGSNITSWYSPGQTWSSVFGALSSSYEECRAECVAMYLACDMDIMKLFGAHPGSTSGADNVDLTSRAFSVLHAAYLAMARAGLAALEFWDPKAGKWGQAHMQARFSILQCFLAAGSDGEEEKKKKPFCEISPAPGSGASEADMDSLTVRIDPAQILTTGRKAVGEYLLQLHVAKSTADFKAGKELYERMTEVRGREHGQWWAEDVRGVVLKKKVPRKVYVMANTVLENEGGEGKEKVVLKEYEASREGMIRSWAERGV